jgi:hypothetical protein
MKYLKHCQQLQQEQDEERKARLRGEGRLLQQVEDHANEFEDRWTKERQDRMDHINKLEQKVGRQETTRAAQQASFQQRVDDELEALQRDLEEEVVQERQTQDEEIVAALNRYVEQLQQSLSIPSSD